MEKLSIIGARGFIGSHLAALARNHGFSVEERRHDEFLQGQTRDHLGVAFYCSGLAWGAGAAPFDAYLVHVEALRKLLENSDYDRLVYLSSTRVYSRNERTDEAAELSCSPSTPDDVYAISKLAGESLTLSASKENRVIRLSNVFGQGMNPNVFLSDVLSQARRTGVVRIHSTLESSKDYISIDDTVNLLLRIARSSRHRIYNVASGVNTSHREILNAIQRVVPIEIMVDSGAPSKIATPITVERIANEYDYTASSVIAAIGDLIGAIAQ